MGAFLVDEQDTLISQPWPPHYKAAAGEVLKTRVLELLRGPCPDNPTKGHLWPLRSILERTVYVTEGMHLRDRSKCAVLSRLLYDAIDPTIDSQVPAEYPISVSLMRWATRYAHQHLFRLVSIFTDSKAHCDKWGLELPGIAPTERTQVPVAGSGGKRHQESPNSSFDRSSASSSSDPPRPQGPTSDLRNRGQSRGGGSSFNPVHPRPASGSTPPASSGSIPPSPNQIPTFPPGVDPSPDASAKLRSKVFELLRRPSAKHKHSLEYWRSITAIIGHCMDSSSPPECKFLASYLHACAGADHISPNNEDAIEHTACLGLIAWVDFPGNKYLLTSFQFRATQIPASLLDHHPGDNYYLSLSSHYSATSVPSPPNPQFNGIALVQRNLSRLIDLSALGDTLMPSNFDPSPGAGAVLRDSILQLLDRPQAPSKRWWSIADLLEQLLQPPVPPASKDWQTAEVLDNYLRAVAILGSNHLTGDHQILCAGLLTWTKLPNYRHLVVTFETGDGREAAMHPVTDIGEYYYLKLPSLAPRSNQVRPTAHPDPYPAVNKLMGEIVTDLLCFEGPTALYSYTVKELLVRLTMLSLYMGYAKRTGIRLFRNYLRMCTAEHSLPTVDDQLIFCIGLLRWAKFPINSRIYVIFESNLPGSHP